MTKKRFIKLAMPYGMQRNEAKFYAALVVNHGSYENLMKSFKWTLEWEHFIKTVHE